MEDHQEEGKAVCASVSVVLVLLNGGVGVLTLAVVLELGNVLHLVTTANTQELG